MPNASRWDLFINGTATQDGVLEIRFGRDRVLVDILGGQDAAAARDLLAAALRGLGYSVDCFWSEPVRGIKTVRGTVVPLGFSYHFYAWDSFVFPEVISQPDGVGIAYNGPMKSAQGELEDTIQIAAAWMRMVEEDPALLLELSPKVGPDSSGMSALAEDLQNLGHSADLGNIGNSKIDCNQVTIQVNDGPIDEIVIERTFEGWVVTGVRLEDGL